MTQVTISRDTLYWRDQIIALREAHVIADQAWLAVVKHGTTSNDQRQIVKGLRADLLNAKKLLDNALAEFTHAAFMNVRGVK